MPALQEIISVLVTLLAARFFLLIKVVLSHTETLEGFSFAISLMVFGKSNPPRSFELANVALELDPVTQHVLAQKTGEL